LIAWGANRSLGFLFKPGERMKFVKVQFRLTNPMPRTKPGIPEFSVWGFESIYHGATKSVNGSYVSEGDVSSDIPLHGNRVGVCIMPATPFNMKKIKLMEKAKQLVIQDLYDDKADGEDVIRVIPEDKVKEEKQEKAKV
jgi:hypothetical protein